MKNVKGLEPRGGRTNQTKMKLGWLFVNMTLCVAPMYVHAASGATAQGKRWTLSDIVSAPDIVDLSVSKDGRQAMYIIRRGDLEKNAKISSLHLVDIPTAADRELKSSTWLSSVQVVPGSTDWSVLADLGEGVQLYRVDGTGRFTPLLVNRDLDLVGSNDEGKQAFGVSDYGWAPDGKSFWYEKRTKNESKDERLIDPKFMPPFSWFGNSSVELHVRTGEGEDVLLDTSDAISHGYVSTQWDTNSSSLTFWVRDSATFELKQRGWKHGDKEAKNIAVESTSYVPALAIHGFKGGTIQTTGLGGARKLVEIGKDGPVAEYGHVTFRLGDPRASGTWISPDNDVALMGTRYIDVQRYGLARVSRSGHVSELTGATSSLTNCSVNEAFTAGVCIRQSMTSPPELVRFDPREGGVTPVKVLTPSYSEIEPLKVVQRTWTNRNGYKAGGFVVYPRDYKAGQKYPAIVVTHGSDADEKFVFQGFQWDYPVQVLAEKGYVVIAMNDPTVSDSAELLAASDQWGGGKAKKFSIDRLQDLVWINGVVSFDDAVKELANEGLVDLERVGIAGYSRGSQMVNVTMTQSQIFRAASSGDGGYLEPSGYFRGGGEVSYTTIFGGSPYDPAAVPKYQRLSPTFRAKLAAGPVLQQVAAGTQSQSEFYVALRDSGIPAELVYYPDESHLFHQPKHRMTAMQENIDWFDFWLLGKKDSDPAKATQYKRWEAMCDKQKMGASGQPSYCQRSSVEIRTGS